MFDIQDRSVIGWAGWWTTWDALRKAGWKITIKPKYNNRIQPYDSMASKDKVYIRHPASKMIGKISKDNSFIITNEDYTLDFLSQECNYRVKPPRIVEGRDLDSDDIPFLLQTILALQEQKPKKRNNPISTAYNSAAEILLFKETA